jgi:protocadherin delta 2
VIKLPIAENVPIGYEIPLEPAIDDDYGLLSIQNYELHPLINNPFRLIKTSKPVLKLTQAFDRENQDNYVLQLMAVDGGSPTLSGQQRIEVIVTE